MTLDAFHPLLPAEEQLLAECEGSERITVGTGECPVDGDELDTLSAEIRADVLRHLMLGRLGKTLLPEKGLRLRGAFISGVLDLQGAVLPYDLSFTDCRLSHPIEMVNARVRGLYFSGCVLVGLSADNAHFDGSLFLRGESVVNGDISLSGVRIEGDMQFCGCTLHTPGQDAIFAPSLQIDGSLFLGNYPYSNDETTLEADGALFLSSAEIANDVFITNCAVAPRQDLPIDQIFSSSEEHGADIAISFARARIGGILYFKDNQIARGTVSLAGASAGRLRDEPAGPGATYRIRLDGFTYDDFSRHSETGLVARLEWLERRPRDTPFTAQPYEHLARVLMHMGHRTDARTVLMRKEQIIRREDRRILRQQGRSMRFGLAVCGDAVMRFAVGYGYRPGRVLALALAMIFSLGVFFHYTWKAGDMTPNAAPILISKDWIAATRSHPDNPGAYWSQVGQAGQDWETFQAFAYAADLVIPIVSLGQEDAWAPSTSRSDLGRLAWWIRWFAKALGWIITALGAAAVTGAVRQD